MKIQETDLIQYLRTKARLRHGTIVTRKSRIFIFLTWLEEKPLTPESIEQFFLYLQDVKKLSNTSLNTYYHALRSLEIYLIDRRRISSHFMEGLGLYEEEEPNIIPLTAEEVRLLKNGWIEKRSWEVAQVNKDLTIFFIDSGARWEDGRILKVRNVDLAAKEVTYIQLKTGKQKFVTIEEPLLSILARRVKNKHPEDLVFPNSFNGAIHYPDYYKYLKELAVSVGITKRISPHVLRHSYAQNHYDKSGDILLTKELLGQKNIRSTMRYAKNSKVRIKKAQQTHPHLAENIHPHTQIELIQKDLEQYKLETDVKFDYLKVSRAMSNFIMELREAILPPPA